MITFVNTQIRHERCRIIVYIDNLDSTTKYLNKIVIVSYTK
jgi:hypothetical protein